MGDTSQNRPKKHICVGLLAHVDAGKTTLSEALLYRSGSIRKIGRVDNGDAFLDTYELERERGITIFSKQAMLQWQDIEITLLDTPGHVDFSAEMERTLQVLDYAVLVINGSDGVQGHTQTLWNLLSKYRVPVFLFINKMDQIGTDRKTLLTELRSRLNDGCIDFNQENMDIFYENVAVSDEDALEKYLEYGRVDKKEIADLIQGRKIFPCFFGSALKLIGVDAFMQGLETYTNSPSYGGEFGARIFKIARDDQGNRLTYMKITGGRLKVKNLLSNQIIHLSQSLVNSENINISENMHKSEIWEEKVNQIRIYSGVKFNSVNEVEAGTVCAVIGLNKTYPGQGLGAERGITKPVLQPVLTYGLKLPEGCDAALILPQLRQLEEEEPELHIFWDENLLEIQVQIMGEVQIEVLKSLIKERFGVTVEFGTGSIVYKETIADIVEGVGHFEPLRHYAEVHLLLEPGERGSGLLFETDCSEDLLHRNWQRLILTHLEERNHKGVLTGAPVTDLKITLKSGRAHQKHTEGGDFRQATYRAVRQGLKQATSVLLEPYYDFRMEIPEKMIGRAMTDMEKMKGLFEVPHIEGETAILTGSVPVVNMQDYQKEMIAYTKGYGRLICTFKGFLPCHNANEIIQEYGYDSERDMDNPSCSVFCAHGAGFSVSWDKVKDYMHVESCQSCETLGQARDSKRESASVTRENVVEQWIDEKEIQEIFANTFYANSRNKKVIRKKIAPKRVSVQSTSSNDDFPPNSSRDGSSFNTPTHTNSNNNQREKYLLVDGYNILFAWDELKELAVENIDGARGRLLDILCNYQGIKRYNLIVVFDAYRVKGHETEIIDYHNIHVVYTKEAETADQYIEKFAHQNGRKFDVTVATSDGLEQIIIMGQGCSLLSAREFREEVELTNKMLREEYLDRQPKRRNSLINSLSESSAQQLKNYMGNIVNNDDK